MWNSKKVSLVFPAYNEEPNIERAVSDFRKIKAPNSDIFLIDEILVIDNNSQDNTASIAAAAGAQVITETKQGYGNALKRGLQEAQGDLIVLAEPDGTFASNDIVKLLSYSDEFQMVCGTRTNRELIYEEANMGQFLRIGNLLVAKMMEVLYGTSSLSDCGCTYRLIRKEAAAIILNDLYVGKSHFLPNMVIAARLRGISMIEIPINYRGRVGESKITGTLKGTLKTGFSMIWLILSNWPRHISRKKIKQIGRIDIQPKNLESSTH